MGLNILLQKSDSSLSGDNGKREGKRSKSNVGEVLASTLIEAPFSYPQSALQYAVAKSSEKADPSGVISHGIVSEAASSVTSEALSLRKIPEVATKSTAKQFKSTTSSGANNGKSKGKDRQKNFRDSISSLVEAPVSCAQPAFQYSVPHSSMDSLGDISRGIASGVASSVTSEALALPKFPEAATKSVATTSQSSIPSASFSATHVPLSAPAGKKTDIATPFLHFSPFTESRFGGVPMKFSSGLCIPQFYPQYHNSTVLSEPRSFAGITPHFLSGPSTHVVDVASNLGSRATDEVTGASHLNPIHEGRPDDDEEDNRPLHLASRKISRKKN